jgi:hypothetical protein
MNFFDWFKSKTKEYSRDGSQKAYHEGILQKGTCPKCLTRETMWLGPQGGSAQNCMCGNCREEFNLFFMNGVTILDYMGEADERRARTVYGWEPPAGTNNSDDSNANA